MDVDKFLRGAVSVFIFVLVLAMFPLTSDPTTDIKILFIHWAAMFLLAGVCVHGYVTRRPFRTPGVFFWPFLAFVFLNGLAALQSNHVGNSLVVFSQLVALFAIYLSAVQLFSLPAHLRNLALAFCLAMALSSMYAFGQRAGFDPFPWDESQLDLEQYRNLPGTFGNPNLAGHALIAAIIIGLYLSASSGMRWCSGLVVLYAIHLIFTQYRAGYAALLTVAVLAAIVPLARKHAKSPQKALAATLILMALLAIGASAGLAGALKITTGRYAPIDASILLRYNSYFSASKMIADQPLLGYGPGNYRIENPEYWSGFEHWNYARNRIVNLHAHNEFLQTAVDAGVLAMAAYIVFLCTGFVRGLWMVFTSASRETRRTGFMFAAFFGTFLVDGLFGFNFRAPVTGVLFALLAGVMEGMLAPSFRDERAPILPIGALAWRGALVVCIVANAGFGTRVFASQFYLQRGSGAMYWEEYGEAERILGTGTRLGPWNWEFYLRRGMARRALGNGISALSVLEEGLQRNPRSIPLLLLLARTYYDLAVTPNSENSEQNLESAHQYAELALALCPMLPEAEDAMGRIALIRTASHVEDTDSSSGTSEVALNEARNLLRLALAHGALNRGELFRLLADLSAVHGDDEQAEADYVRAVGATPEDPIVWSAFYAHAIRTKAPEAFEREAYRAVYGVREGSPDWQARGETHYLRVAGIREYGRENREAALETYREAVEWLPASSALWGGYYRLVPSEEIQAFFRQDIVTAHGRLTENEEPVPVEMAAVVASLKGDAQGMEEAIEILDGIIQTRFQNDETKVLRQKGGWAPLAVFENVNDAFFHDANSGDLLLKLGLVLARFEHFEQTEAVLSRAMPLVKGEDRLICLRALAASLVQLGREDDAERLLYTHWSEYQRELDYRLAVARTLAQNGKASSARLEYALILQEFQFAPENRTRVEAEMDTLESK